MHFDDRLATVLRNRATGERSARTQYRQLIDLLGERPEASDRALKAAAYLRLMALADLISVRDRTALVGEAGWRFRNPELVRWFADAHPHVAAAALTRAQLTGAEWAELIPRFPIQARGFLRNRKDLPEEAVAVLDQLGVADRALPMPEPLELTDEYFDEDAFAPLPKAPAPVRLVRGAANILHANDSDAAPAGFLQTSAGIRALVDRIEAFKRAREQKPSTTEATEAPVQAPSPAIMSTVDFRTDARGRITWSPAASAPMVVGFNLTKSHGFASALADQQPVRGGDLTFEGAPAIAGNWVIEAVPRFSFPEGQFEGYIGRMRRAVAPAPTARQKEADTLRQLLHELRTPVNAMQGYAEIIQQQMIGPVPHEYRAIAANITGDAARILAGFDELDRLARLETGAIDLADGHEDFAAIVETQVAQLQSVLAPRVARIDAEFADRPAPIALAAAEGERMAWRLLASLAGPMAAGERIELRLATEDSCVTVTVTLPHALRKSHDAFAAELRAAASPLSSGMFGAGFSLRLARAEARAAGGDLLREGNRMILRLPLASPAAELRTPEAQSSAAN